MHAALAGLSSPCRPCSLRSRAAAGASVRVTGVLAASVGAKQAVEIKATAVELVGCFTRLWRGIVELCVTLGIYMSAQQRHAKQAGSFPAIWLRAAQAVYAALHGKRLAAAVPSSGGSDPHVSDSRCHVPHPWTIPGGPARRTATLPPPQVGGCDAEAYPLQKKRHTLEFLRSIAHLRPRTNTLGAVARVRRCAGAPKTAVGRTLSFFSCAW
jgi:hypothetical protein